MPRIVQTPDVMQRIARLEAQVAALSRAGWERDELPLYPTSFRGMVFEDSTSFLTVWEAVLSPRTATLALGLVLIGDQVSGTNTGGSWQVLTDSTVVASGSVPPTFSYVFPTASIDLTPYRAATQLKVQVQVRRTSGATTGGKYGAGGSIGCSPTYARLL